MRQLAYIRVNGPSLKTNNMKTSEALVAAYNAVENDQMHGIPNREEVLAVIRALLRQPTVTDLCDLVIFNKA